MDDDISFAFPDTAIDRRPGFQRTAAPIAPRVRRRCATCDRPGPFRSGKAKRCITCEGEKTEATRFYQRVYQLARSIAVAQLIQIHHDDYDRLLDDAWVEARERVLRKTAADEAISERARGRKARPRSDLLDYLPEPYRSEMKKIRDHGTGK